MSDNWFSIVASVLFFILYTVCSGGFAMRLMYAYKVAKGTNQFYMFPFLYLQSFVLEADQVNGTEDFSVEINNTMEKHLALVLDGQTSYDVGKEFWTDKPTLKIYYHNGFSTRSGSSISNFMYKQGKIGDQKVILSPSCYRLTNKIIKKHELSKKEAKRKHLKNILG